MIPLSACVGCHDDFYNGRSGPASRCWSAEKGTMITRYRIHYLTEPTRKGAYTKVLAPSCYHQVNRNVFHNSLPAYVKPEDLNRKNRA